MPPRNRDFVGRDDFLAQLHATLLAPEPAATAAALQGLGGIGKSSLAGEYAHRFGGDYAGVWWVPAENRTMLIGSLVELATAIDDRLGSTFLPRIAEPPDLEKLARAGLSKLAAGRRPWLLIYDNVESPDAIEGLVPGAGARLLITTRFADWPGWASEIALDVMSAEAATEFLLRRSGGTDRQGAAKLAAALGHLPLALDHAGAYLRRAGTSFARYCDRVEELIGKEQRGISASVRATFGLAIERVADECPAADILLSFLSMLAPERIPLDIIDDTILPEAEREDALAALTAVSLVRQHPFPDGTPAIAVHRLVQAAARSRNATAGAGKAIIETAIRRLAAAFPDNGYSEPKSWPRCEMLLPHAFELQQKAHRANIETREFAVPPMPCTAAAPSMRPSPCCGKRST